MISNQNQALRVLTVGLSLLFATGCGVVVKGGALSNRPDTGRGIYLTTGGAPRAFRTLGFVQVRGYGVNVAGMADVGDAALDGTIKGRLVQEAAKMGGHGVINIEFLDENPQTMAERASSMSETINQSIATGTPQVQTKDRWVTVTGEVIQFVGQ